MIAEGGQPVEHPLFEQIVERFDTFVVGYAGGHRGDHRSGVGLQVAQQRIAQIARAQVVEVDRVEQPQLIHRPRCGHVESSLRFRTGERGDGRRIGDDHRAEDDRTLVALEIRRRPDSYPTLPPLLGIDPTAQGPLENVDLLGSLQRDDTEICSVISGVGKTVRDCGCDGIRLGLVDQSRLLTGGRALDADRAQRIEPVGTVLTHRDQR